MVYSRYKKCVPTYGWQLVPIPDAYVVKVATGRQQYEFYWRFYSDSLGPMHCYQVCTEYLVLLVP